MSRFLQGEVTENKTGKVLFVFRDKPMNKFFWEKAKAEALANTAKKYEMKPDDLSVSGDEYETLSIAKANG